MSKIKIDNIKKCINYFSNTDFTKDAVTELRELVRLANIGQRLLNSVEENYHWVRSDSNDSLNTVNENDLKRLMDWECENEI